MPETRFVVRWPDDRVSSCYSPSLVVKEYLCEGHTYKLPDFIARCRTALTIASERVRQKYGFYCTAASSQLAELESIAATFPSDPVQRVTVLQFE